MVRIEKHVMKNIPVIFFCLLAITACRKGNHSSVDNNGTRLTSIVTDSAGTFDLTYTNNLITGVTERQFSHDGSIFSIDSSRWTVQYSDTVSNQLVSLNVFADSHQYSLNYILTSSRLPSLIFSIYKEGNIMKYGELCKFIYFANTDILDSVIQNYSNAFDPSEKKIFKFKYSNQNITEITESEVSPSKNLVIATFDFTYGTAANIFRQTDPLLYIYSYPLTVFGTQPMVIAAFFAETFSLSTFNSITTSGITTGAWFQNSISSKMNYQLNAHGKVTEEIFSNNIFQGLAGKKYLYE